MRRPINELNELLTQMNNIQVSNVPITPQLKHDYQIDLLKQFLKYYVTSTLSDTSPMSRISRGGKTYYVTGANQVQQTQHMVQAQPIRTYSQIAQSLITSCTKTLCGHNTNL